MITLTWCVARAASIAFAQRRTGLKTLFQSIAMLDPSNTTAHGIAVRAARGGEIAAGVPISLLAIFLRSVRIVGTKPLDMEDWRLQPLSEVGLLELLQQAWGKSRNEETAFQQSVQELNAPDYDHLNYEQFEAVLVQLASQTFSRLFQESANSFFSTSDKASALLDYLEVPMDMASTSVTHPCAQSPMSRNGSRSTTPGHGASSRTGGVGRSFGDSLAPIDTMWLKRPGTSCSSIVTQSFRVSRPGTQNSARPGTAESSNTAEYWQKVMGGTLRPQSRGNDSMSSSVSGLRPQTKDPLHKRAQQTGHGQKGIARQWLREAIRIINPGDTNWRLTQESIKKFLICIMKVTPESCDILKPDVLSDMFVETDLDKDGTVSLEELSLSVSARFKRRYHADRWKTLVRMANQVSLQRKHWPPEVYLNPPIDGTVPKPKSRNSIRAQYEMSNNFPDHCGYGPVTFDEGLKTEKLNAGMSARSKTWQTNKNLPHATRPRAGSSIGASLDSPHEVPNGYRAPAERIKDRGPMVTSPGRSPAGSPDTMIEFPRAASPHTLSGQRSGPISPIGYKVGEAYLGALSPVPNGEWNSPRDDAAFQRLVIT